MGLVCIFNLCRVRTQDDGRCAWYPIANDDADTVTHDGLQFLDPGDVVRERFTPECTKPRRMVQLSNCTRREVCLRVRRRAPYFPQ
jgi:hypothetical protein